MSDDAARGFAMILGGPTNCGKSRLWWHLYGRHAPRKITIEVVPETHKLDPSALRTFGFDPLNRALADCTRRQRSDTRWHIIASLEPDEIERLFWILCPKITAPDTSSFARAVGGLTVFCGELAYFAGRPLAKGSPIKDAYLRGRHHWLSMHGATQHLSDCDPCTRMQSARCVFFQTVDKLGLDAVSNASSPAIAERVAGLAQYHSLTWVRAEARAYIADATYRVTEIIDYRGAQIASRAIAGTLSRVAPSAGDSSAVVARASLTPAS